MLLKDDVNFRFVIKPLSAQSLKPAERSFPSFAKNRLFYSFNWNAQPRQLS